MKDFHSVLLFLNEIVGITRNGAPCGGMHARRVQRQSTPASRETGAKVKYVYSYNYLVAKVRVQSTYRVQEASTSNIRNKAT